MPSVLIVDDDPNMCFLERMVLETAGGQFQVVGEVPSGEEAIRRWRDLHPQVIVMDDHLPGMRGLDAARLILAEQPDQVIVLVTAHHDAATAAAAFAVGVRACLPKKDVRRLPGQLLGYWT
jgi:two-component system invasion response regulator UvrY